MEQLVSTEWLAGELGAADLITIDASSHLPDAERDPAAEFEAAHIPGARFLNLRTFFDPTSPVPAALPNAAQFSERMAQMGISENDRIVIYDDSDVKTSARAWFIFRMHGAKNLAILDGGLGKWRAEGRVMEGGAGTDFASDKNFTTSPGPGTVRFKADILANLGSRAEQVVDARGAVRFRGELPESRPGVVAGHIPGSLNLPFSGLLNDDGTFKDAAGLRAAIAAAGIDLDQPITTTCGGGVTAIVVLFAMLLLGKSDVSLYDGSWAEWGSDPDTPKAAETAN